MFLCSKRPGHLTCDTETTHLPSFLPSSLPSLSDNVTSSLSSLKSIPFYPLNIDYIGRTVQSDVTEMRGRFEWRYNAYGMCVHCPFADNCYGCCCWGFMTYLFIAARYKSQKLYIDCPRCDVVLCTDIFRETCFSFLGMRQKWEGRNGMEC